MYVLIMNFKNYINIKESGPMTINWEYCKVRVSNLYNFCSSFVNEPNFKDLFKSEYIVFTYAN